MLVLTYLLGMIKAVLVCWNLNIQLPGSRQWKPCKKDNDERLLLLQGWQRVSRIKNKQKWDITSFYFLSLFLAFIFLQKYTNMQKISFSFKGYYGPSTQIHFKCILPRREEITWANSIFSLSERKFLEKLEGEKRENNLFSPLTLLLSPTKKTQ